MQYNHMRSRDVCISFLAHEASLIVPDFTISAYGSSCKDLVCGLILSSFLSFSIYVMASHPGLGMQINRTRKQRSEKKTKKG